MDNSGEPPCRSNSPLVSGNNLTSGRFHLERSKDYGITVTLEEQGLGAIPVGVLEGIKVLDLSEDIAGSFCGRLLADYGADVLKLEPPGGASLPPDGALFRR